MSDIEVQVTDHYLPINDLTVHYRDWGDPQSPPLMILHGFDAHSRSWDYIAARLADRFRVIVPDLRGNGESSWAPEYTWQLIVEDTLNLIDALDIHQIILGGHSMGGRFAYMLASQHPERVACLVIIEANPYDPPDRTGTLPQYTDSYATLEEAVVEAYKRQPYADKDNLRHEVEHALKLQDDRWTWRMDPALRMASWLGRLNPGTKLEWPALAQIQCPAVLIYGAYSLGKMGTEVATIAQTIPDCQLIEIPDAAHDLANENPAAFVRALRKYLNETPGIAAT